MSRTGLSSVANPPGFMNLRHAIMARASFLHIALAAGLCVAAPRAMPAAEADMAWQQIVALDAGPQAAPGKVVDGRAAALAHLQRQERVLRYFIASHPADPRGFEARLRLSRVLQIRGDVEGSPKAFGEAQRILDELEKSAAPDQRAEVAFAQVTLLMRSLRAPGAQQKDRLLAAAKKFQREFSGDRRLASLLAEVATLFPLQPATMRSLLEDANALARDEDLKGRIADDLKRLNLLGQPVSLRFDALDGSAFDIEKLRGSVVLIAFFAVWSQPSLTALETLKKVVADLPRDSVRVVAVSLDTQLEPLAAHVQKQSIGWPVGCDRKGWESPLVRSLGINALPTVWLLDKQGRLRSLNALEGTASQVRQLLRE